MAEDYYPGDTSSEEGVRKDGGKDDAELDKAGTCLVPRSLFQGQSVKVGEEYGFKVVHEYGDEIEIEYAKGGDKKPAGGEKDGGNPMAAFDETFSGERAMGGE